MALSQIALAPGIRVIDLGELSVLLAADRSITDAQRLAYQGAIRTLCKVLACRPEAIPADPRKIDQLLNDVAAANVPAAARPISRKTLANVRSRLKAALRVGQSASKMPPHGTILTPAWRALHVQLIDLRMRHGLSRLVRVASFRGIAPDQVDDPFVRQLADEVSGLNWGRDALPFWRRTVALWNEASATIAGWPATRLTPPPAPPRQRHLPIERFPISFRDDLEAYLRRAGGQDLLAHNAPSKPIKPGTVRLRREQLRIAASMLAQQLRDTAGIANLAALVDPANAKAILTACLNATPDRKPTAFIRGLALTLVIVARQWVELPGESPEIKELLALKRRLGSTPTGLTEKNRRVVLQCSDPATLQQLLKLPDTLRRHVQTRRLTPGRRLQKMQIALAIELLLVAPMRLQNLASLCLGRQLQWPSGRGGPVFISLRPDETKNDQPLEYPVEEHARELLHEYLDRYRAYAKVADIDWLFVHLDGTPVPADALRDGITKATKRELGIAVTPHQFRHLAAAITLDHSPGAIGMVRDLLGHQNIKTTLNFYAGMRTRQAGREWSKILNGVRHNGTGST